MMNGRAMLPLQGGCIRPALALSLLCLCMPLCSGQISQSTPAQTVPGPGGSHPSQIGGDRTEGSGPFAGANQFRLEHLREEERHKRIVADTARLVALTGELKEEVEKTTKDQLSLDVVRKAAEIEKLAREVKERMKS